MLYNRNILTSLVSSFFLLIFLLFTNFVVFYKFKISLFQFLNLFLISYFILQDLICLI